MHKTVSDILTVRNNHLDRLISILGVMSLCKITNTENISDLVNQYNIDVKWLNETIEIMEEYEDTDFKALLTDEYFECYLQLMLLAEDDETTKGSVSDFLK